MLRLEKIAKRFANGTLALEGINLEVAPQTIVSIVGVSGSGKSTLLRVISGLETPSTGQLSWHGQSIQRSQRAISFIFRVPERSRGLGGGRLHDRTRVARRRQDHIEAEQR